MMFVFLNYKSRIRRPFDSRQKRLIKVLKNKKRHIETSNIKNVNKSKQ